MKEFKEYYDGGQISQHYWKNEKGNLEDEYKEWHYNGQPWEQCFYKDGLKEGVYKSWWNNGQLASHCFYKNGLQNDEYKRWHKNGQPCEHGFFKNDLLIGEYKSWRSSGQLGHVFLHNYKKIDIYEYVADKNNITEQEYFQLQLVFGYFPIIKFDGKI